LLNNGIKVYVIAPKDSYTAKLIAEGATFVPIKLNNHGSNPIFDFNIFLQLLRIYRKYRFDRVLHYTAKPNIYGTFAARVAGLYSVAIYTGLGRLFQLEGIKRKIIHFLLKWMVSLTTEIWFLNIENKKIFFSNLKIDFPDEKIFILKSEGINTQRFSKKLKRHPKPFVRMLFAGRLLKDKGVIEFVEAAKIIKTKHANCKFELLGMIDHTNDKAISLATIEDWQKKGFIKYLGSTEDVRLYLDRSDILVFPSYYNEGLSRILLEAASMELPIITTDQIGCREVVLDGITGLLCQPKSVQDLTEKIEVLLLKSDEEKYLMGQRSRDYVKKEFNEADVIEKYFKRLSLDKEERVLKNRV
jgi:glycosyltransferase involved in cell wall biosynthesis